MLFEDRWFEWMNWLVAALIAVATVFFQGRWITPDVYTMPLGPCDVDWHVDRGIVALACAGRDMIKVWPLPVETPWWEDGLGDFDKLRGQWALTSVTSAGL